MTTTDFWQGRPVWHLVLLMIAELVLWASALWVWLGVRHDSSLYLPALVLLLVAASAVSFKLWVQPLWGRRTE